MAKFSALLLAALFISGCANPVPPELVPLKTFAAQNGLRWSAFTANGDLGVCVWRKSPNWYTDDGYTSQWALDSGYWCSFGKSSWGELVTDVERKYSTESPRVETSSTGVSYGN